MLLLLSWNPPCHCLLSWSPAFCSEHYSFFISTRTAPHRNRTATARQRTNSDCQLLTMSRPSVLTASFHHPYSQQPFVDSVVHPALSYRPTPQPLPLRPPEYSAGHAHQHPHHAYPHNHQHLDHHHARPQHPQQQQQPPVSMAGNAYMPTDEELAHLQKLSHEYDPEVPGPLVGERQSSTAITTEYANADPVYRVKTAALPSKYSHFRTCKGDGNCGWRAIAFTYFETLIRLGDANRFEDEKARLMSMNNLLNSVGFQEDIYIEFADECFGLLQKLAVSLRDGTAANALLDTFNDLSESMAIITYFKLLTSAWMQTHAADYAAFLGFGQTVKEYCSQNIETVNCEIDHVGISALSEALLKPAGFALHVLYLDRTPGEEINGHHFGATESDGLTMQNPPTLRLLYRPGHYDILYKAEDVEPPMQQPIATQAPLHVALAAGYTDEFVPISSNMSDVMTMIPGLYPTGLGQRWPSAYDYNSDPTPQQQQPQIAPVPSYAPPPSNVAPIPTSHQEYVSPVHSHVSHQHHANHHSIQMESPVGLSLNHPPPPLTIERGGPFRPSMYELEPGFHSGQSHALPFQTSIFRNSHYNTAHFRNPDFQPEEWSPDADYSTSSRSRHKSTSQ